MFQVIEPGEGASAGEHIERGEFLRQDRRLPKILRQYRLGDSQRRRRVRDCLPRNQRRKRPHEMIRQTEGRVAKGLDGAQESGVEIQGSEGHGDSTSVERASRRARNRATVCPA